MQPQKSILARLLSSVRSNLLPLVIFFALGAVVLYGQRGMLAITSYVNNAHATASTEMSGAEVAAQQAASGWVPAGTGSKYLYAAGFFFLFIFLIWIGQSITAKPQKRWAKRHYSREFLGLTPYERFQENRVGRWQLVALACASIIAAALIV
jgi:hypothetical protein